MFDSLPQFGVQEVGGHGPDIVYRLMDETTGASDPIVFSAFNNEPPFHISTGMQLELEVVRQWRNSAGETPLVVYAVGSTEPAEIYAPNPLPYAQRDGTCMVL